jgi:hypothetical protein
VLILFRISIACIENLPDELFYEVFDYLDGCSTYEGFSNLNARFQRLLTHPSLPLKINLSSTSELVLQQCCTHIVIPNTHRIVSLSLSNLLAINLCSTLFTNDSPFHRLESLVLNGIKPEEQASLLPFLVHLRFLPRLVSLTITVNNHLDSEYSNPSEIYRLIFDMPSLKYSKIAYGADAKLISLSITTNERFSSIEHLSINHPCTVNQLSTILSHTPRLCRLSCDGLLESRYNTGIESMTLPNLTHLFLISNGVQFNEFEIFIKKISSQLRVLHMTTARCDEAYLNADRWERLISEHLPRLQKFAFAYCTFIRNEKAPYYTLIKQFTSSFWIKRRWFLQVEMNRCNGSSNHTTYSIRSHRFIA